MAAAGVAAWRAVSGCVEPWSVRAGRVAQPAGGVVCGVGSEGPAGSGGGVVAAAAGGAIGSAAGGRCVGRVGAVAAGVLRQLVGVGGGPAAGGGHGGGAAVVRCLAVGGASAGPVACAGLPSDVSGGVGVGSPGGAELRVGAVAVGSSGRSPGLGRPDAGVAHRSGGVERPFSGVGRGSRAALGLARPGRGGEASVVGLGGASRGSAVAVGDVRVVVSSGDELPGGGLVVRGPDVGSAARVGGFGGAEGGLASGSGGGLGGGAAASGVSGAGVVSGLVGG